MKNILPLKDTVRGYEYAKDQFIVLDENDFKKVPVKTAHSISILGFVEAQDIDSIYYQNSHYIEPEELGAKPFALLKEVLVQDQPGRYRQSHLPEARTSLRFETSGFYYGAAYHVLS